ncbi:MAG: Rieske 2Fe-2S domain-containing protein [Acidimicrobiia bacterium]|nr:Rieske 2Fe-2S domain-containing protein [Acidimicrobiia bacterium]
MWHVVPGASTPSAGDVRAVELEDRRLALWRTESGVVVACEARCPHQWADLATEGVVAGEELVCTAHGWRFSTDGSGSKLAGNGRRDDKAPVEVFPVRSETGCPVMIWIGP